MSYGIVIWDNQLFKLVRIVAVCGYFADMVSSAFLSYLRYNNGEKGVYVVLGNKQWYTHN